ncbi:MAG: type II CAAX endopeptidase family protein [Acidimicrobiaceae bacterium]|nr:type II CAAX endopeptidase family protein [Acidimicrobiaceae bacterium]MDE0607904.1 type II CAAX endopeptidase family protein [Acidimicrobiaceae bacterium]
MSVEDSTPTPGSRVLLAFAAMFAGIVASALAGGIVVGAAGWDFDVPSGLGDDFGRVAGQVAAEAALGHNRVPLVARVLLAVPLWACLLGVPWLASRRKKLDLRRDFGWGVTGRDVGVGLLAGIGTQALLLPLIYMPILRYMDSDALEAPARNLVASANSSLGVLALVVLTVVGAPIAEEFLYRGLLHRGLADKFARRGRIGTVLAVLGSSTVFAASHFQLLQFPGLLAVGIVAAAGFEITGRLGTAVWIHVGFNATSVVVLLRQLA